MRVSISKADLTHLLGAVTKVVEHRNTIPILSNVVLAAAGGRLTARATDLDIEAQASIAVLDAQDGSTTVEAKLLADIAKRAAGDITMELDGDTLLVKSGRSRFKLQTLPVDDYPTLDAGTFDVEFEVDLAALVESVSFAISTETTRYHLNGVYLHVVDGALTAVATDGHRLARNVGQAADEFEGVILPRKLVSMLPRGTVKLALSQNKVRVTTTDAVLTSKLIDGTFPDYQRVITKGDANLVTFDKDALLRATDRVSVIASERGRAVRLSITAEGIDLTARGEGEASDSVEATLQGDPLDIGFNSQYVRDMLSALPDGAVTMALGSSGDPAVVTSAEIADWLGVLMPVRVV